MSVWSQVKNQRLSTDWDYDSTVVYDSANYTYDGLTNLDQPWNDTVQVSNTEWSNTTKIATTWQ